MRYILETVKEQFAKDYNCTTHDFNNRNNLVTDLKAIKGRRIYTNEKEILKILIFEGKAIICADECIKEWCINNLSNTSAEWFYLYPVLRKIDNKLNEFGYEIDNTHHYYLPKESTDNINTINNIRWYEKEDINQFKDDDRFDEAFAFDDNYPDILAVAALDNNENIIAMAGASEDSETMWQIGINVLPEAKGKGIGKDIVALLKNEILKRDKIPFYGTIESHIASQKVAIKSGFYPAFAELKARKKSTTDRY